MSLENDITQVYVSNNGTSVQSTASTTSTQSSSNTSPNTVFDKKAEELAKKLGITQEEYLQIAQDPKFSTLSSEEQIKYIAAYKAAKQSTAAAETNNATAATNTAATAETEQTAAAQTAASTTETESTEETTNTKAAAQNTAEAEDNSWAKDYYFDSKKYSNLKPTEMFDVYVEEYAKNKFLYGDKNNHKDIEAWNNLSDKERKQLIKDANKLVRKELGISKKLFAKDVKENKKYLLQSKMTALQAANEHGLSLDSYYSFDEAQRTEIVAEYLNNVKNLAPENLSNSQRMALSGLNTALEATKAELAKQGLTTEAQNISFGDIAHQVNQNDIKIGVAIKELLTQKQENGTITAEERLMLKTLNEKVTAEALESFGIRFGEQTIVEKEMSDSKFAEDYANASSPEQKNAILAKHAWVKYKNDPDKLLELIQDANECGKIGTAIALRTLAKNSPKLKRILAAQSDDQKAYNTKDKNVANSDENVKLIAANINSISKTDPETTQILGEDFAKTIDDEQVAAFNEGISSTDHKGLAQIGQKRTAEIENKDTQMEAINAAINNGSEVVVTEFGINADKFHPANQETTIAIASGKYDGRVAKAITDNETITRLDKEAQTGSFKAVQMNLEKFLPKDQAIESLNNLADQIAKCDVSNQLDMHKAITGSKYSEVQEHAASNIHNYDKSVQADAIKATYQSGNTKAIEAANLQLSQCDPEAVKSIAKEVQAQVQAMEARHTAAISTDISTKLTSMDAARDPAASEKWSNDTVTTKREEYREMFKNADAATKFRMISKLQGVWQKEIITHIATYCPEMLSSLISSLGSDLFQLQLTPEVKNKIMLEMLRVPDMQADALEYFKNNTNSFSSSVKQTCAEMLVERQDSQLESPVLKQSLRAELAFMSTPDDLVSGGKVSNREYYNSTKNDLTFWKRDKEGYFIC